MYAVHSRAERGGLNAFWNVDSMETGYSNLFKPGPTHIFRFFFTFFSNLFCNGSGRGYFVVHIFLLLARFYRVEPEINLIKFVYFLDSPGRVKKKRVDKTSRGADTNQTKSNSMVFQSWFISRSRSMLEPGNSKSVSGVMVGRRCNNRGLTESMVSLSASCCNLFQFIDSACSS